MYLIPYQVKLLEEEYRNLNEQRLIAMDCLSSTPLGYYEMEKRLTNINTRQLEILKSLDLNNGIIVYFGMDNDRYKADNRISIGTTFVLTNYSYNREEVYTLIETIVSTERENESFITVCSHMGSDAFGKKVGDLVFYPDGEVNHLKEAVVTKIFTKEEQDEYFGSLDAKKQKKL